MPQLAGGGRTGREKKRAVRKGLPVPTMKSAGMFKKSTPKIEKRKGNTALKPIGVYKKSTSKAERRAGTTIAAKSVPTKKLKKAAKTFSKTTYRAK